MLKKRLLYYDLEKHLERKEFSIVTGARQTGKTSLLKILFNSIQAKGWKVFFLTMENSQLRDELNQNPENLFNNTGISQQVAFGQTVSPGDKMYVLIDEIQYLDKPSNFLKYLYDKYSDTLKLIVTGSSAFYIDRKFTDSLAGRKRLFCLRTLNFEEYLRFKEFDDLIVDLNRMRSSPKARSKDEAILKVLFNEYLIYGGYPAIVLEKDTREKVFLLDDIKNSYIKRDIHESKISNEIAFMNLFRLLAGQCGSLVNCNELSVTLKIDNKTVDNYLFIMRKCFHIELLRPYMGNIRKEITKMPKVYFYDLGMRNALLNRFDPVKTRDDKGHIIENYLFIRLAELYTIDQINFWRTADNHEIDFVVSEQYRKGKAIEVKYDTNNVKAKKYELFTKNFPDFPLSFVSYLPNTNSTELIRV